MDRGATSLTGSFFGLIPSSEGALRAVHKRVSLNPAGPWASWPLVIGTCMQIAPTVST